MELQSTHLDIGMALVFDNLTFGQFDFQSHLLLVAKLAAIGVTLVGHLVTWLMSEFEEKKKTKQNLVLRG